MRVTLKISDTDFVLYAGGKMLTLKCSNTPITFYSVTVKGSEGIQTFYDVDEIVDKRTKGGTNDQQ